MQTTNLGSNLRMEGGKGSTLPDTQKDQSYLPYEAS